MIVPSTPLCHLLRRLIGFSIGCAYEIVFFMEYNPACGYDTLDPSERGSLKKQDEKNIQVASLLILGTILHLHLLQLFLNSIEICFCVWLWLRFHLGLLTSVCQVLRALVTTRVPWHFSLLLLVIGFILRWRTEMMLVQNAIIN